MKRIIALAGRPNTGKTTLFNALTGMRQRIANFAGCTVEKAVGTAVLQGEACEIVDLPGTHSLLPHTEDEHVSFRFLSECSGPDVDLTVLCVAEASNLTNDLALAVGLRDAGYPVALVVNMVDEARHNGVRIDSVRLSTLLRMPVLLTAARSKEGLDKIEDFLSRGPGTQRRQALDFRHVSRLKLRELQEHAAHEAERAASACVSRPASHRLATIARSIKIDRVLFHPIAGLLVLAAVMFLIFQALFTISHPIMDFLSSTLASLTGLLRARLPEGALSSFLCDGALPGISAVVVFVPQIAILFTLIGALEQSGYLPRAGATVDRALRPFGLDGKVFIPFLSSFACAIPGIMAARTIASERRRLVAILLSPLMTCSARLPVYSLIISSFVPESFRPGGFNGRGVVMAGMYLFGVVMALILAFALKWTSLHDADPVPATVLPPYRRPRFKELARYVRFRVWHFLSRAGGTIFVVSLLLWALASFPKTDLGGLSPEAAASAQIQNSVLGRLGRGIEPVFRPLGWDWKVSVAVLSSMAAREVFVGTLGSIYAMGSETHGSEGLSRALREAKKTDGSPLYGVPMAAGLLIFFAIALQCVSSIAVVRRETGSWKWPAAQFTAFFVIAYALSFASVRFLTYLGV